MAQRHMQLYGTSHEQLGAVAVAMRKHAQLHPNALMHGARITLMVASCHKRTIPA